LRYTVCIRTEENFCAIKWETSELGSFLFGAPFEGKPIILPVFLILYIVVKIESKLNQNFISGKDSEFGECSFPFPFVQINSKTGKNVATERARAEISGGNLPGVVPPERDPLFPHRLCNG
jgi:hypothetical protein